MRLIEGLLHPKPEQRWTIKQIKECAWFNEEASLDEAEVVAAMKTRRRATREKKQEKRNRIEKEKGKGYTRAVGDEEMKYDDEEHHELMRKLGKHNPKTLKLLSTQLFTNVHPIELKDKLAEQFDSIQVEFECPDEEEKPF